MAWHADPVELFMGPGALVLAFVPSSLLGLKYLSLWMALLCHACFAWGSARHFRRSGGTRRIQRRMLRVTVLSGLLQGIGLLFMNHGSVHHVIAGAVLFGLSLTLFWSAVFASRAASLELFFTRQDPGAILRSGPYRFIRHPFYTAYMLAWAGGAVAANEPLLLLLLVANGAIYVMAALREERQFADSPLAAAYAAYKRSAGMFWPGTGRMRIDLNPSYHVSAEAAQPTTTARHRAAVALVED
jgi:protein-S-isoprenylcysteine O-methyltransferase Ste14